MTLAAAARSTAGERGGVRLVVELRGGRTRITELECRPPLQLLRLHDLDHSVPDLATAILASPSGGILDGDRIRLDIRVGRGARLRVGSQSATRIYRTPDLGAQLDISLVVADGGYLELMTDPYIPYRASHFSATTHCEIDAGGTLLLREIVGPGRTALGEVLAFERFESSVELARPNGEIFATDVVRLDPDDGLDGLGLLGGFHCVGSLFVVDPAIQPDVLLSGAATAGGSKDRATWGASLLPGGAGAWLRVLARDVSAASVVLHGSWAACREALVGVRPPPDHRF